MTLTSNDFFKKQESRTASKGKAWGCDEYSHQTLTEWFSSLFHTIHRMRHLVKSMVNHKSHQRSTQLLSFVVFSKDTKSKMAKQRWGSREWIIDQHYKEKDQTEKEKNFNIQASQTSFRRSSVKYLSTAVWWDYQWVGEWQKNSQMCWHRNQAGLTSLLQ